MLRRPIPAIYIAVRIRCAADAVSAAACGRLFLAELSCVFTPIALCRLPPEHRAAYRAALGMDDDGEDGAGQAEGPAQEEGESRPPIFIYEFKPR